MTSSAQRKPKLRWLQLSMRTLLIGMLLTSGGLGRLIHDVREQDAVVKMIEKHHGSVEFGELNFLGRMAVVRSLFGEHAFAPVTSVTLGPGTTDAHVLQLKKLQELQSLSPVGARCTGTNMKRMPQENSAPRKPKLRWFQFSMRTLLVVLLLMGCGLTAVGDSPLC